jgi:hypothetical protein
MLIGWCPDEDREWRWAQRLSQPSHLPLRLLEPEPHFHLGVQRRRGGEVLSRLIALSRSPVQLAEAEVDARLPS